LSQDDDGNANLLLSQPATLTQTAQFQSESLYVTSAAGKVRLGVYDNSGPSGGPGKLLATTGEFVPVTGWNTVATTTQPTLQPGTYWLSYLPSSNGLGFKKTTATTHNPYASFAYGPMPASFPATSSSTIAHWSFYASLAPAGAGDTTPPSVPTGLALQDGSQQSQVSVSWTASTDPDSAVAGYYLLVDGTKNATVTSGTTGTATGLSWGSHAITVEAFDAAGNTSAPSSSLTVTSAWR
jgi:hypothetical protein